MAITPMLAKAAQELMSAAEGTLKGTEIETITETVNKFAIASAVAVAASNVFPGVGGVIAMLTQTGMVWALYLKINDTLGISIKKDTLKFVGSAMMTNAAASLITVLAGLVAAAVLSVIPGVGQLAAGVIDLFVGYVLIYVCAILYLNFLTKVFHAKGSFDIDKSEQTKDMIKEVVSSADVENMAKEGKAAYKQAKKNGDFERAKEHPTCPFCGADITLGQAYCSHCGHELK